MKITLRKADALKKSITEAINGISLDTTVSIGRYDDPKKIFDEAVRNFARDFDKKTDLTKVLYDIRADVSAANDVSGISDILAEIATIDKTIAILKPLSQTAKFSPAPEVLETQHADLKAELAPVEQYRSRRESFEVSIVDRNQVQNWLGIINVGRKQKQDLSDKLLELNVQTEIELQPEVEDILTKYGII